MWFKLCQTWYELPLRTTLHTTWSTWWAPDVLHVICTRLRPGHMNICVGDSLQRNEEIVKKSRIAPFNAIIIIIVITTFT